MGVLVWYKKEEKVEDYDEGLKNEETLNLTRICVIWCNIQWRVDPALMQVKSVASDLPVIPKYLGQISGTYQASSFWFSSVLPVKCF
jgi:hypothetical protein